MKKLFLNKVAVAMVAASLCSAAALSIGSAAAKDVTMFQTAPSVEELERALGTDGPAVRPKVRTRSIQFDDGGAAATAAPQQAQPASTSSQVAAAPAQQKAVSDRAVGFPINFDLGKASIRPDSTPFLESIAGLMAKDGSLKLLVEGHTDASGNFNRNVELSQARALSVMNYLITKHNIAPQRFQTVGKGPTEPLDGTTPFDASNRRVQFRVIGG